MGKKPVHPNIQAQAAALHDAGLNQVQILKQLKVSRCCVITKCYKEIKETTSIR